MKKIYIPLFILFAIASSCTKEEETGNTISITGFVSLYDENNIEIPEKGDVKVEVQNTGQSVFTDPYGKYVLSGLQAATSYRIIISKENFGEYFLFSGKHVGDAKPALMSKTILLKLPDNTLDNPVAQYRNDSILISGNVTGIPSYLQCMVFVSSQSEVSDTQYQYSKGWIINASFTMPVPLKDNAYAPGATLYVAVYFYHPYAYIIWDPERIINIKTGGKKVASLSVTKL